MGTMGVVEEVGAWGVVLKWVGSVAPQAEFGGGLTREACGGFPSIS